MKKYFYFTLFIFSFNLIQCTVSYKVIPSSIEVKKSGLLSFYINNHFYNVENHKNDVGLELLGFFLTDQKKNKNKEVTKPLIVFAKKKFLEKKIKIGQNYLIHPKKYILKNTFKQPIQDNQFQINNFNFDESFKIEKKYFTFVEDLKAIHLNGIVEKIENKNQDITSTSISYEEIGNFAKKVGLDGFWILEIDAGYKKIDFLGKNKIKPSVSMHLVMIDRKGVMRIKVFNALKNERKRYLGELIEVEFSDSGYIDFNKSNTKVIYSAYAEVIGRMIDEITHILK